MTDQTRGWSPAELRRAMWLAHPHTTGEEAFLHDGAALRDTADATGVTPRTVQRWLVGASRPRPAHAQQLRTVLAPPAGALRRQQMDWHHQVTMATELAHDRTLKKPRPLTRQWREQGWHTTHVLWLLHHETLGIYRLMVSMAQPVKPTAVPTEWTLKDRSSHADRPTAVVAKYAILEQAGPWRVGVSQNLIEDGRHECWLDTAPDVTL